MRKLDSLLTNLLYLRLYANAVYPIRMLKNRFPVIDLITLDKFKLIYK